MHIHVHAHVQTGHSLGVLMLHSLHIDRLKQQVVDHHTAQGVGEDVDGPVEVRVTLQELIVLFVDGETKAVHYLREGGGREGGRERKREGRERERESSGREGRKRVVGRAVEMKGGREGEKFLSS